MPKRSKTDKVCANCAHWKNQQAELGYTRFHGICTCHKWKYSVTGDGDVQVLDRQNISHVHTGTHRFENQSNVVPHLGEAERSRYCLVTEEHFGCIHFSDEKTL